MKTYSLIAILISLVTILFSIKNKEVLIIHSALIIINAIIYKLYT